MKTPFDRLLESLLAIQVWSLAKLLVVFGLLLYLGFAGVVIRQVNLMSRALNGAFDFPIKTAAWVHFLLAIVVFLLAIFLL